MAWSNFRKTLDEDPPWREEIHRCRNERIHEGYVEAPRHWIHRFLAYHHRTRMRYPRHPRVFWITNRIYGMAFLYRNDDDFDGYLGRGCEKMDVYKSGCFRLCSSPFAPHRRLPPHDVIYEWNRYVSREYRQEWRKESSRKSQKNNPWTAPWYSRMYLLRDASLPSRETLCSRFCEI